MPDASPLAPHQIGMDTVFDDYFETFSPNATSLLDQLRTERDVLVQQGAKILPGSRRESGTQIIVRMPYQITVAGALNLDYKIEDLARILAEQGWGDEMQIGMRLCDMIAGAHGLAPASRP